MATQPKAPLVAKAGEAVPVAARPVAVNVPYDYRVLSSINLEYIRALVFGAAKVGKTEFLLTFPNVAVADFDGEGVKVALNPGFKSRHGDVERNVRFQTFEDEFDPATGIIRKSNAFTAGITWTNHVLNDPWTKTYGLDSLSSFSAAASNAGLIASDRRGRSQALKFGRMDNVLLLGKQDFGAEMGAVEQLLDQLMQVKNRHVIVLAHESVEKAENGMVVGRSPLITGDRLRAQIAKWFDEVWYLESRAGGKRVLVTQPTNILKTVGSRLGLTAEIPDPTYEKIIQQLRGGK